MVLEHLSMMLTKVAPSCVVLAHMLARTVPLVRHIVILVLLCGGHCYLDTHYPGQGTHIKLWCLPGFITPVMLLYPLYGQKWHLWYWKDHRLQSCWIIVSISGDLNW